MAIIKPVYEIPYAQIPNKTLQDMSLSHTARSILVYLLSKPDNWKVTNESLRKQVGIGSKGTFQKYINELKKSGYMEYRVERENGKLKGGDWFVYPEPQKPSEASDSKASTSSLKNREPAKQGTRSSGDIQIKRKTNKESKSVNNTREAQNFQTSDQKSNLGEEHFADKVMTELLADNLPSSKKRYANLKIREYQERFPESSSVADCWAYVVQAVKHQYGLTGS